MYGDDHGPGRSFATELSKVLDASLSHADRMKVFGGNYRRTWAKDIPEQRHTDLSDKYFSFR